ncbi:putative F-box protein [Abeliophyllum distichum]|uniref:F-box protein n=1 Tax=Abeliophyllum distichum TaxID=126358 RepID=A0ABD1TG62_9LAMI
MEEQRVEKTMKRMSELPDDILVDVLSRLPEKSLCRFTCVSKEWHSFISSLDPGFVKDLRRKRLRSNSYIYIWNHSLIDRYGPPYIMSCDVKVEHGGGTLRVSIVDTVNERIQENYSIPITTTRFHEVISCHNLVCFAGGIVSICNLITKEKATLPDCGRFGHVGFGYSSLSDEFKVVRWFMQENEFLVSMRCEIFSLTDRLRFKSDSWNLIDIRPFERLSQNSVFVNGVIYWLIYTQHHPNPIDTNTILATDLDKDESKLISCPNLSPQSSAYLVELKECLYLAHCWNRKAIVKMWRLEDPSNCVWVSEYYINFASIRKTIVPLTSVLTDHFEKLVFISLKGKGLFYYDVEKGTMRKPYNLGHLKLRQHEFPCVLKYMEF